MKFVPDPKLFNHRCYSRATSPYRTASFTVWCLLCFSPRLHDRLLVHL